MMYRRRHTGWTAFALAAALIAPALVTTTGCQSTSHHDQNVNAANDRWLAMRSAMMLELGQQQFDTGDLDNASRTINDGLSLDPANVRLHVLAGRIALERSKLERAYHLFNAALSLDENEAQAHYYKGLVHQRWQQYEEAHQSYKNAYDIQPDDAGYLLAAAEMLVEMDRVADGITMLRERLTYFDQNAAIRGALGHLYAIDGRPDEAARYFKRAAMLDPDNDKLREELALAQLAAGEVDEAIKHLRSLLDQAEANDRRDLRLALARAYEEAGQTREAREQYLKLARGERATGDDWIRLAEMAWQDGDLGGTLYAANQTIQLSPRRHEGYLFAGLVWQKREKVDDALQMFDRAADLAPEDAAPLILRGVTLQRAGRPAAAAEAYEQALARQPDDARARRLLSQVSDGRN